MLDDKSKGAIGTVDIGKFYDSIDVSRVCMWLCENGFPCPVAAGAVWMQLLPRVVLGVNKCTEFTLGERCIGSLTGTRVAGALGA
eukprot:10220435-Karenia_brevis.AAC.1